MIAWLRKVDRILKGHTSIQDDSRFWETAFSLIGFVFVFGMTYGAGMGSFGGVTGTRFYQALYSALKVPLLLLVTFGLSVPSFFVINTLLGLRTDLAYAIRSLIASQAVLTIILASLTPFTILWYVSFSSYQMALLFNGFMFGIASVSSQLVNRKFYEPLIQRNKLHRVTLHCWIVIYTFVGIQMAWILRPFVGNPGSPISFFREDTWGNAYVILFMMIWRLITG